MPSFSFASSMIGRFLASWAIAISDLGLVCCDAGMGVSPGTLLCVSSNQPHADGETGGRRELAGADFRAVGGLNACDLDAAVGADDGEAVGLDRDHLAVLAADALGILGRDRLNVEDLQDLAV